jgi:1-acyl-sn-glycerol-3-phosphate acyltransferase
MEEGSENRHASDVRARTTELRTAAAAKRDELRETAAERADALRHSAAAKGGELRTTAAMRGSELGRTAAQRGAEMRRRLRDMDMPWARCAPARMARESILQFVLKPLIGIYARMRVNGRDTFDGVPPPVVLVANHSSHLDTPTILRALPRKWRQRTAVAAAADYFYTKRAAASAVALAFNTIPIMRRGGGGAGGGGFDHVDRLIQQRWNLLMFPEGTRSRDGSLGPLRSGAAVIAQQHGIPIVPVHLTGTRDAMPPGRNWPKRARGWLPRRHRIEVSFGPPVRPADGEAPREMMTRVRAYLCDEDAGHATNGAHAATGRFARDGAKRDIRADA